MAEEYKGHTPDSYLHRKKEIELKTGVAVDETMMEGVIYGSLAVSTAIQIGMEQKKTPEEIFFVAAILVSDFIKLQRSLKK